MEKSFLKLVSEYNGFEFVLGFREDEDHFIGGTGNTVWYHIQKGNSVDCMLAEKKGEVWTDVHIVKNGKKEAKKEAAESGSTLERIQQRAFFKQEEIEQDGRKPVITEISGYRNRHYAFSFGARAYDILDEYGITVGYSNIDDEQAGYRLRNLHQGDSVTIPDIC